MIGDQFNSMRKPRNPGRWRSADLIKLGDFPAKLEVVGSRPTLSARCSGRIELQKNTQEAEAGVLTSYNIWGQLSWLILADDRLPLALCNWQGVPG